MHGFFTATCGNLSPEKVEEHWRIAGKDVIALADHANFVSSKVTFILDATLGLINSDQNTINGQQNKIIKLFSVLAVVLLPPHIGGQHLWDEFPAHATVAMALGLPARPGFDAGLRGGSVPYLQIQAPALNHVTAVARRCTLRPVR